MDDDVRVVEAIALELHEFAEAVGEDALYAFRMAFFVTGVEDFEVVARPEGAVELFDFVAQSQELDVFFAGDKEGGEEHHEEDEHDDFDRDAGVADEARYGQSGFCGRLQGQSPLCLRGCGSVTLARPGKVTVWAFRCRDARRREP